MKFVNSDESVCISVDVDPKEKHKFVVSINDCITIFNGHRYWKNGVILYKQFLFIPFFFMKKDLETGKFGVHGEMCYILMNVDTNEFIKRVHPKSFEKLTKHEFIDLIKNEWGL
jgi:hypothetical protein